jgi:hypothetical protein
VTPAATVDPTWTSVWEAALDELELTLEQTERLLGGGDPQQAMEAAAWTPPQLDGPLPDGMLGRAQSLLSRQRELIGLTVTAMSDTQQNITLLGKVNAFAGSARTEPAVYLDLRA